MVGLSFESVPSQIILTTLSLTFTHQSVALVSAYPIPSHLISYHIIQSHPIYSHLLSWLLNVSVCGMGLT
jgi:predicted phosphatase